MAQKYFENFNVDLIYGWEGQTLDNWKNDLELAAKYATHLSLYNLTYEPQTPIGRKMKRGVLSMPSDEALEAYYSLACNTLDKEGYDHEEVSNWSKNGYSCRHNWLYWRNENFLGVGTGAHGYLPDSELGIRYSYSKNDRIFQKMGIVAGLSLENINEHSELINVEPVRTTEDWLIEFVGTGLRTCEGLSVTKAEQVTGLNFTPTHILQEGLDRGLVSLVENRIVLKKEEWFREASWAVEIINSILD